MVGIEEVSNSPKKMHEPLISETRRVLDQQVSLVQNQQAQSTKIIRVALTLSGLLLTLSSILLSVAQSNISNYFGNLFNEFSLSDAGLVLAVGYIGSLLTLMVVFILLSALEVLEPHAESNEELIAVATVTEAKIEIPKSIHSMFKFYRKYLLPPPFSNVLTHRLPKEQTSLRPGIDADEARSILDDTDSFRDVRRRIIDYNSGCIEGNEKLIQSNRQRLSKIYTISSLLVVLTGSVIGGLIVALIF